MENGSRETPDNVVPLSNRRGTSPKFGHGSFGVDRLSLSFPLAEGQFEPDPEAWNTITVSPSALASKEKRNGSVVVVPGAYRGDVEVTAPVKAFVGIAHIPERDQWFGKVEFNPARVLDPDGHSLADPAALLGVIDQVLDGATDLVLSPKDRAALRVKRLDVARDFSKVSDPAGRLAALAPVPRPWARRNMMHNDPARHGAQTLSVGSGAGLVRAYDKHAETLGGAPEGTLRVEAEGRSAWLDNYGGISTVADLCPSSIEGFFRNRWEWSAMGAEVSSGDQLVSAVVALGLTPSKERGLLGYLVQQAYGRPSDISRTTAAEYRRLQRRLGIVLSPTTFGAPVGTVVRLDLDSGREVYRAA